MKVDDRAGPFGPATGGNKARASAARGIIWFAGFV